MTKQDDVLIEDEVAEHAGTTWIDNATARLARIGADPADDEDLRQKKSLLVLIAVLILPVSVVWGCLYLGFGSWAGITAFIYFAVSLGSLVIFARTGKFRLLLVTQCLDILLSPTAGQMFVGGFLPSGGVALWAILAPLGALVFLEVRRAIRWFVAFVLVFLLTGMAGELFFPDAPFPTWFPSTMLALNIVGAGADLLHPARLLREAAQRGAGGAARRAGKIRAAHHEHPAELDRRAAESSQRGPSPTTSTQPPSCSPMSWTSRPSHNGSRRPRSSASSISSSLTSTRSSRGMGSRRSRRSATAYMAAAGVPDPCPDHACMAACLALDIHAAIASSADRRPDGLELRIGINSGPVIAGVIGTKRFLYDLWGDAVNTASRMESNGSPGEIQITRATYELLKDEFVCRPRGTIEVKGKGPMETWYLEGPRSDESRTDLSAASECLEPSSGGLN